MHSNQMFENSGSPEKHRVDLLLKEAWAGFEREYMVETCLKADP